MRKKKRRGRESGITGQRQFKKTAFYKLTNHDKEKRNVEKEDTHVNMKIELRYVVIINVDQKYLLKTLGTKSSSTINGTR